MLPPERDPRSRSLTALVMLAVWFGGTLAFVVPYPGFCDLPGAQQDAEVEFVAEAPQGEMDLSEERRVIPGLPPPIENGEPVELAQPETTRQSAAPQETKPRQVKAFPTAKKPVVTSPVVTTQQRIPAEPETPPSLEPLKASAKKEKPAQAPTTAKQAVSNRKPEKPVVHFPYVSPAEKEVLLPKRNQARSPVAAHKYPGRYKPLPPPLVARREGREQTLRAYDLGNRLGRDNRLDEAAKAYWQAIKLSPDFADAYVGLSTVALLSGNSEVAYENAQKALSMRHGFMDPENITRAQYNLAAIHCVMDDYRKAKRYYDKVKKANYPLAPQLWAYLELHCKQ